MECWAAQPYEPVQPGPLLESWRWQSFPELKGLGLSRMAEDRDCISTVSPLVQEGVDLSYEIDDSVGETHTDEARLRQMLINLASNAIKFSESGHVELKAN